MSTATKKKSSKKVKLQPLGDRVVVEREASEETTAGGIVLPGSAQDKPARGTVVSVGDGKLLDDGRRSEMQVKKNDEVIFTSYAGTEIKMDGDEYMIMDETDILGLELTRVLFRHEDEMKPVSVVFWYQLIQWIGDIADYSEKVGDRLRLLIAR